jgi:hypothetical protein
MERNKRILLSPSLEVANEKVAFLGEDVRTALWSAGISHWDPPCPWLLPGEDFNAILIESIHDTIANLLNLKVAKALFEHLEKVYSIKKDEVPSQLDTLLLALKTPFGSRSAQVMGRAIAKRFYSRLGLEFLDDPQRTLAGYVESAKLIQDKASYNTQA